MKNFEEIKKEIFKDLEGEYSSKSFIVEPEKVTVSEEEVEDVTAAILEVVKGFRKCTLRIIKNSKDPFNEFIRVCGDLEKLAPESKTLANLRDALASFKEEHRCIGAVVSIITTIIGTVVRLVFTGIKALFKIVGAVLVALANIGYKIVQGVRGMIEEQLYTDYIIRDN